MVQISTNQPTKNTVDIKLWLERVTNINSLLDKNIIYQTVSWLRANIHNSPCDWDSGLSCFKVSLELGETVAGLKLDQSAVIASLLYRACRENKITIKQIENNFDNEIYQLVTSTLKLANLNEAPHSDAKLASKNQLEILRKMLVALVDDVRVVLIKMAERTCAMRLAKNTDVQRRIAIAKVTADIYAPLAHRLGIGHLKWELEDLAFRYLEPNSYKYIARLLQEKRLEREQFIDIAQSQLSTELSNAKIEAKLSGRVKHIYSIWRKMQLKNLSFDQIYDIRALRVLVNNERDCYTALGVVHRIWQHIPREFDDYIANPKPNGYRSLHTAVIGPDNKTLEVQIRTYAMHEEAELGLCAHWNYKGFDVKNTDDYYSIKIEQLRKSFEDYLTDTINSDVEALKVDNQLSRVYVFTPKGHVIDLARGSTVLDFAYRIHTEVGHSCRGAKVNGRIVPLNTVLKTGQQVQIITAKNEAPSRDWINPHLKFLVSPKAKAKVLAWFKNADRTQNISIGKSNLDREFKQLGIHEVNVNQIASSLKFSGSDDMFAAIGAGTLKLAQVIGKIEQQPSKQLDLIETSAHKNTNKQGDFIIAGVGNMLNHIASCCKPVPGEQVIGYITVGRGVSIHRADCLELLQLANNHPERIIEVSFSDGNLHNSYPVDIHIEAYDRVGLLRDITAIVAGEKLNLLAMQTITDKDSYISFINLTVEISNMQILSRLLVKITGLPNVIEAKRKH